MRSGWTLFNMMISWCNALQLQTIVNSSDFNTQFKHLQETVPMMVIMTNRVGPALICLEHTAPPHLP